MKKNSTINRKKILSDLSFFIQNHPNICTTIQSTVELSESPFYDSYKEQISQTFPRNVKNVNKKEKLDIYQQFIDSLKIKKYVIGTFLEKHHILPLHAGGDNSSGNLISLSIKDHALAHFYRFLAYNDKNDKLAYHFRKNDKKEAFRLRAELGLLSREKKGLLKRFKDSKAQALLGIKGGQVAGSLNTLAQRKARQRVGEKYGRIVGKSNQSELLKKLLTMYQIWEHDCGIKVKTRPCNTFKEVCNQLESAVPNKIRNESSLIKVLYGQRLKIYGWKLLIMVIRSEVGEGLLIPRNVQRLRIESQQ